MGFYGCTIWDYLIYCGCVHIEDPHRQLSVLADQEMGWSQVILLFGVGFKPTEWPIQLLFQVVKLWSKIHLHRKGIQEVGFLPPDIPQPPSCLPYWYPPVNWYSFGASTCFYVNSQIIELNGPSIPVPKLLNGWRVGSSEKNSGSLGLLGDTSILYIVNISWNRYRHQLAIYR